MRKALAWFRRKRLARRAAALLRLARGWERLPERSLSPRTTDVRVATERYLLYVLLPAWLIPGFLDYLMHRRTRIEHTSGTRESAIHALMMSEVGAPVLLGLLCEINPLTLALMIGSALVHEATAFWDVTTAIRGQREVRPNEQHLHSFLEILPFMAVSFAICLHRDEALALLGRRRIADGWRLKLKRPRLKNSYLGAIVGGIVALLALPYAEELTRCVRTARWARRRGRALGYPVDERNLNLDERAAHIIH